MTKIQRMQAGLNAKQQLTLATVLKSREGPTEGFSHKQSFLFLVWIYV